MDKGIFLLGSASSSFLISLFLDEDLESSQDLNQVINESFTFFRILTFEMESSNSSLGISKCIKEEAQFLSRNYLNENFFKTKDFYL